MPNSVLCIAEDGKRPCVRGREKVTEEHTPDQVAFRVHRLGCLPEVACRLMKEEIRDGRIACVSEHAQRLSRRREKLPHWRLVRPRKVTPYPLYSITREAVLTLKCPIRGR
jgi:hypothetical protein